jgi:hypothetical protein
LVVFIVFQQKMTILEFLMWYNVVKLQS